MRKPLKLSTLILLIVLFSTGLFALTAAQKAKKMYESGMAFYTKGEYEKAITDFDNLLKNYPNSKWAPEALLQKGIYLKDVKYSANEAESAFTQFINNYPNHAKVSKAMLLSGDLKLRSATTKMQLNAPLSIYIKLRKKYPGSPAAAEASYKAADIYFKMGEFKRAFTYIKDVGDNFAQSDKYSDAMLLKGKILSTEGEYVEAAKCFQSLVSTQQGSYNASIATKFLNLLQRLFFDNNFKYTPDPSFKLTKITEFDEPRSIFVNAYNQVSVYDSDMKKVYTFDHAGTYKSEQQVSDDSKVYVTSKGNMLSWDKNGNLNAGGQSYQLQITVGSDSITLYSVPALAVDSYGNLYVVNEKGEHVFRFDSAYSYRTRFSKREFDEIRTIAVDPYDRVYIVDSEFEGIMIFNQTGADAGAVKAKGTGYELQEPRIIRFDSLNNMYVYDSDSEKIHVFNAKQQFVKSFKFSEPVENIRDFAVTDSGEIYILDGSRDTVFKLR